MSGNVIDIGLIFFVVVFAISGYRQGFLVALLSFVGLFGGALLGLRVGPLVAQRFENDLGRVIVSLVAIFGLAIIGHAVATFIGIRLRYALRRPGLRRIDDAGGALVSVTAVLLVVWLAAAPLGSSSLPWLAR